MIKIVAMLNGAHRDVEEVIKKIDERTAKEQEIDSRVERMVEEQTKLSNEIHQISGTHQEAGGQRAC